MSKRSTRPRTYRYRSSVTGRYVSKRYALEAKYLGATDAQP
jgi:hypothetical protein